MSIYERSEPTTSSMPNQHSNHPLSSPLSIQNLYIYIQTHTHIHTYMHNMKLLYCLIGELHVVTKEKCKKHFFLAKRILDIKAVNNDDVLTPTCLKQCIQQTKNEFWWQFWAPPSRALLYTFKYLKCFINSSCLSQTLQRSINTW